MPHQQLVEDAHKSIKKVFEDTSVPQETTKESLEALQEEIELLIDSLD